jgi:PAS domain S-box-containing protein
MLLLMLLAHTRRQLHHANQQVRKKDLAHRDMLDLLEEKECRLRTIIESEPECVKLQAADGTVLEINPAGLRLVDATCSADIVGRPIYDLVAPDYVAIYRENMRRVFAGEALVYEFKAVTLKGRSAWMETHAAPLRDAGGVIYALLGITRDITEHKQSEEQTRRHLTELARVARLSTMGEMATGIAHELNQPLSAIANFARGCIRHIRTEGMDPAELVQPLTEVCEQAERAGDVLRHVRAFVRRSELQLKPSDINYIVRTVVKFSEFETRQHGATVLLNLDEKLPLVMADGIMIEQVVGNLMRNAMEAMAEAHSQLRQVTVCTSQSTADAVEVSVVDTGPGIQVRHMSSLFDQFFTTKPDGVGMGLAISRSIIESHSGSLKAENGALGGAIFRFHLNANLQVEST